jgi:ferrous iron transport protein A
MLRLSDLTIGEQARVKDFSAGEVAYRQRLLTMGITKGTVVTVVRKAPLGCPLAIEVRNCVLILRQNEANCLIVDRVTVCAN